MTTKDVAVRAAEKLVEWPNCTRPIPEFLTQLPWAAEADDAIADIVERILNASTVEEVIARSDTVEFADLKTQVITVYGFRMMPSTIDTGVGAYAVVDFVRAGSEAHEITTTSALGVLAQLARIYHLGGFPFKCSVLEIDTGKNGKNNPLYLAPAAQGEEPF